MSGRTDVSTAAPKPTWDGRDRRAESKSIEYLANCIDRIDQRLDKGADRMDAMDAELAANTKVTTEVRELLETGRAGLRVLGLLGKAAQFLGGIATAVVAIWGLWTALKSGAPKP